MKGKWKKGIGKRIISMTLALILVASCLVIPAEETQAATSKIWNKVNGVCYNGKGKKIPNAIKRGIDVSQWQGSINWSQVAKSNVDFAFIRVGHSYGTTLTTDTYFTSNMSGATAAGIPVGVYYYSGARTTAQAVKEAKHVIKKIQGYKISYPVVFDLEASTLLTGLSDTNRANIAMAFCNEVKKAGYYPMLYCNTYWYDNYINKSVVAGVDKWLAAYGDSKTSLGNSASHTIWQATDGNKASGLRTTAGLISGIPTYNTVDIDFAYVDYTKKISPRTKMKSSYTTSSSAITTNTTKSGWQKSGSKWYYYKNGKKATGWLTLSTGKYYLDTNGVMITGWKKLSGSWYYFNKNSSNEGVMKKGWLTEGTKRYYLKSNGKMATGRYTVGGRTYYFSPKKISGYSEGQRITGWKKLSDKWYYFRKSGKYPGSMVKNEWIKINKKWYFLQKNGVMKTGWLDWKGQRYYLTSDGSMRVGWLLYKGKYYYLLDDGRMAKSTTLTIGGRQYKFNSKGVYYK